MIAIWILFALAAAVGIWAHTLYGLAYPPLWNDEVHFIVPAISFAKDWNLDSFHLLNFKGSFSMPPLLYWVNGLIFKLTGSFDLQTARWASFTETLLASGILFFALKEFLSKTLFSSLIAILWFATVPVQIASNMARPEALSTLISFLAILAWKNQRFWWVIGIAILSVLNHPLHALPCMALGALSLLELRKNPKISKTDQIFLTLAGFLLFCEAFRLFTNFEEYTSQWRYQLARKSSRTFFELPILLSFFGTIALFILSLTPLRKRLFLALPIGIFSLLNFFDYSYGREMWYGPFRVAGVLFFFVAFILINNEFQFRWTKLLDKGLCIFLLIAMVYFSPLNPKFRTQYYFNLNLERIRQQNTEQANLISHFDLRPYLAAGNILVDPFIYGDLLPQANSLPLELREKIFTPTPFSTPDKIPFSYFISYYEAIDVDSTPKMLAHYQCENRTSLSSPTHTRWIAVRQISRSSQEGPFRDCR